MAKSPKQNDEVPNEIFAAAPIEAVIPAAPETGPLELAIILRPNGESNFDVLTVVAGKETTVESNGSFSVARAAIDKLAHKMMLASRREVEFIP